MLAASALLLEAPITMAAEPEPNAWDRFWQREVDEDFSAPGYYVGMAWTFAAIQNFEGEIGDHGSSAGSYKDVSSDRGQDLGIGFQFRLGARSIDWLGYELEFEMVDEFRFDSRDESDVEPLLFATSVNAKIFALHPIMSRVLEGRIQPYLMAGMGMLAAKDTKLSTPLALMGRFGAGVDFFMSETVSLNIDGSYVMPTGNLDGFDYYSFALGLRYHF